MKKLLSLIVMLLLFSASSAFAACTAEEFQQLLVEMQTSLSEIAQKDSSKLQALNTDMEKLYTDDLKEIEAMSKDIQATQDAAKAQELLDKSCALYAKINAKINEYK